MTKKSAKWFIKTKAEAQEILTFKTPEDAGKEYGGVADDFFVGLGGAQGSNECLAHGLDFDGLGALNEGAEGCGS